MGNKNKKINEMMKNFDLNSMVPKPPEYKGLIKDFSTSYLNKTDEYFFNSFFISINIIIRKQKGFHANEIAKKLYSKEMYFLPEMKLFYLYKIPKCIAKLLSEKANYLLRSPDECFRLSNGYDENNVSYIIHNSYKLTKEELESSKITEDNYLTMNWNDLLTYDCKVHISKEHTEVEEKSNLNKFILKKVLELYIDFTKVDFELLYNELLSFSKDTLISEHEITKMHNMDKYFEKDTLYNEKIEKILRGM